MSIPAYAPGVAAEHSMSEIMVMAMYDLVDGKSTSTVHGNTLLALQARGLLLLDDNSTHPTATPAGHQVVARLRGQPEPHRAPTFTELIKAAAGVPRSTPAGPDDGQPPVPRGFVDNADELEPDPAWSPPEGPYFSGVSRWFVQVGDPSGQPPVAVVVGNLADAQSIADRWNLANLRDIARMPDADYAGVGPAAEIEVHVFDRAEDLDR